MGAETGPDQTRSADGAFWARVREHKVIQWAIAYLGAALALAHGAELVSHALNWPDAVWRTFVLALIVGFPIALTIAWYHGHKGLTKIGAGELSIISVLLLIGAVFFIAALRPHAAPSSGAAVSDTGLEASAPRVEPRSATLIEPARRQAEREQRPLLPNSVAVLPFTNLSPNPDDAYFAQGIHEEVLNQLAKLGALNVIARTSVLRYANTQTPIPEIARELNVKTVLEGSVRYAGDDVRITAQLIDPATGAHLWSDAYQRKLDDVFAIQADIAMNIANALRAEFSIEEQRAIETPPTSSPAAYDLYLKALGIAEFNTMPVAHELLDRALALDPRFAAAHAVKARLYYAQLANNALGNAARPEQREAALRQVREYADRALALQPGEPLALALLDALDVQSWRWSRISPDMDLRTLLSPSTVWVHAWAGNAQLVLPASQRWTELDPNNAGTHFNLGILYAYAGDRDASSRSLRRAIELLPASPLARAWIAYNAVAAGDTERALAELQSVERVLGENPPIAYLPELAYAYGRIGRAKDARRFFTRIEAAGRERDLGAGSWALGYLAIGDEEHALEQLELAATKARNHEPDVAYLNLMNLRMNFLNDPRVTTPRFAEVLARIRGD
jgi:TolB-like protein/Tfp pilus assembly protein PilF